MIGSSPGWKPSRRTTKRFVWANVAASWATIWASLAFAPDALQWLAVPVLGLIVGIFAFYTGTGTADLVALTRHAPPAPPANRPVHGADVYDPNDYRGGIDA